MIATGFSVLIRLELSAPGTQFLQGDHQLYNVIITAHGLLMLFFMVKKNFNLLDINLNLLLAHACGKTKMVNDNNNFVIIGNNNNNNNGDKKPKHNYVKVLVEDPFNNRDIILKVAKKQKGVYL